MGRRSWHAPYRAPYAKDQSSKTTEHPIQSRTSHPKNSWRLSAPIEMNSSTSCCHFFDYLLNEAVIDRMENNTESMLCYLGFAFLLLLGNFSN